MSQEKSNSMSGHQDGGPAFPTYESDREGHLYCTGAGVSLRDYAAIKAMQGWIASAPKVMGEALDGSEEMADVIAMAAYVMADAMLRARAVSAKVEGGS